MKECTVVHTQTITKTYYIDAKDGDEAEDIVEYGRLTPKQLAEALFTKPIPMNTSAPMKGRNTNGRL